MTRSCATMLDPHSEDETLQARDIGCKHFTRSVRTSREARVSDPHSLLCRRFANSLHILDPRATSSYTHLQSISEINAEVASNTPSGLFPAAALCWSRTMTTHQLGAKARWSRVSTSD